MKPFIERYLEAAGEYPLLPETRFEKIGLLSKVLDTEFSNPYQGVRVNRLQDDGLDQVVEEMMEVMHSPQMVNMYQKYVEGWAGEFFYEEEPSIIQCLGKLQDYVRLNEENSFDEEMVAVQYMIEEKIDLMKGKDKIKHMEIYHDIIKDVGMGSKYQNQAGGYEDG